MGVPNEQLQRAIAAARTRESQGYFGRVQAGDQRAASLFVRLVAGDLNPSRSTADYGWLTKSPGESQVDGYAEDAICFGADPYDLQNVVDMVNGAGAPGASIGGAVKERRTSNHWATPWPLTQEELDYLRAGSAPGPSPGGNPYPGDDVWDAVGVKLFADYGAAGVYPNPQMGRWFGRTIWDATEGDASGKVWTVPDSIAKHQGEWRAVLPTPPGGWPPV